MNERETKKQGEYETEEVFEHAAYVNEASDTPEMTVRKRTGVRMKKGAFVALLLAVCLIGAGAGGYAAYRYAESKAPAPDSYPGYVTVPEITYNDYKEKAETFERASDLIDYIEENYYRDVDRDTMVDGMLHGIVDSLGDPYSAYLTSEEFETLMMSYEGEFYGIGVSVTNRDGVIYIVSPIDNTPAQRAGVRAGDVITHVDGIAYSGDDLDAAVNHMRGEAGKSVNVTIMRDGTSKEYTFVREKIVVETVRTSMLEQNVGYIRISEFENNTASEFKTALKAMEKADVTGLVVDLRSNPGGLVDQAVKIADEFLDDCVVVYTEDRDGNRDFYSARSGRTKLPVVFLCDGGSASASEILLSAMKDYNVGEIVGKTTFGKGIIQEFGTLWSDGAGLKLTILEYFSPNGNAIHGIGIEPTVPVDYREDIGDDDYDDAGYLKYESDDQLRKAVEILTK
jgi:carboxyl-terminal processing protease